MRAVYSVCVATCEHRHGRVSLLSLSSPPPPLSFCCVCVGARGSCDLIWLMYAYPQWTNKEVFLILSAALCPDLKPAVLQVGSKSAAAKGMAAAVSAPATTTPTA